MENQSIKINIFGRQLPVTADDKEEGDMIKQAADILNRRMRSFSSKFSKQDEMDIALMCCLEVMVEHIKVTQVQGVQSDTILNELSILEQKLVGALALAESK